MENKDFSANKEKGAETPLSPSHYLTSESVASKVTTLPSVAYDTEQVQAFIDLIFHDPDVPLRPGEHPLVFFTRASGVGYPKSPLAVRKAMEKEQPYRWYFGTSTCGEGEYLHQGETRVGPLQRNNLFKRLYVVVLDDIGTKVPLDALPPGLKPTYIIESSPGNFQWGFVLDKPIDTFEHAQALIKLVYNSGFSDGGGALVCKAVRLPCGVNGKEGANSDFPVRLVHMDGPLHTPDDILKGLNIAISWDEILKDPKIAMQRRYTERLKATPWLPFEAVDVRDGIADPLLSWLCDTGKVVQDNGGDFVDIVCPWHEAHSENTAKASTAGYSPLGRGGPAHKKRRGFHCFHDSCKERTPKDFMIWAQENGAPDVPMFEAAPELLSRLVAISGDTTTYDLDEYGPVPNSNLRNIFPHKVEYLDTKGNVKSAPGVAFWQNSPHKLIARGFEYIPSVDAPLAVSPCDGKLKVNLCQRPTYEGGAVDTGILKTFFDFIDYLVPDPADRKYFLDWLAAKVQDPVFRGNALIMVTPAQGTGRTTLRTILGKLFLEQNVTQVSFQQLVGHTPFDTFLESLIVFCNETADTADYRTARMAREALKEFVDTTSPVKQLNPKYGKTRPVQVVASFLMFSNHVNSINLDESSRRFYVLANADAPHDEGPDYYTRLHQWINTPDWARHLWNWLKEREITTDLYAPAPLTEAKIDMIHSAATPGESVINLVYRHWGLNIITWRIVAEVAERLPGVSEEMLRMMKNSIMPSMLPHGKGVTIKVDGRNIRWRAKTKPTEGDREAFRRRIENLTPQEKERLFLDVLADYRYHDYED